MRLERDRKKKRTTGNDPSSEIITFINFEKGHTFMSADSFHASAEKSMRKIGKIYRFEQFTNCIESNGLTVEMDAESFHDLKK